MRAPSTQTLAIIAVGLGNAGLGYDVSLIGGLLTNPRWFQDLNIPPNNPALLGTLIASFVFASTAAAIPSIWLNDYVGRRGSMLGASIVNIIGVFIQTFSTTTGTLIAARAITGAATGVFLASGPIYLNELCPVRAQSTALGSTIFFVGSITSAWCAFGGLYIQSSWSWRIVLVCQLPWPIVQFTILLCLPESPRWLVMKGKVDRAREQMPDIEIELHEGSWRAFFTPIYRVVVIVALGLATQWTGGGIIEYYLPPVLAMVGIRSPLQQAGLFVAVQVWGFIISIIGAYNVDRFGRRTLLLWSCCGILLFLTVMTICSAFYAQDGGIAAAAWVVIAVFGFTGSYSMGFTSVVGLYTTELVPTELRAKAAAFLTGVAGAAVCMNQWVNPIALAALKWKYYPVYIGATIATMAVVWFAPETKGLTLEEAAKVMV